MKPPLIATVLFALALQAPAYAEVATQQSAAINQAAPEQQIKSALREWLVAVSSGQAGRVAKLYADNAVLLPTLSPKVLSTPEARLEYFTMFTAKPEIKGTIVDEHIRILGDTAVDSGLYTFSYKDDGATVEVPARYTFVYSRTPSGWQIVEHHSSKLP